MAHLLSTLTVLALCSALISRSAAAQHGASVSLTHTVIVTVPPRVKVQVGNAQVVPNALRVSGQASANGLSLSIAATQPWTLSIGAASKAKLQWSRDGQSDYTAVTERSATVASGELSQIPASAQVFVRPVKSVISARNGGASDSDAVILTVVAQ